MVSRRLQPFGSTVFTTITAKAREHEAIDLGQGYPSWEGPDFVKQAAATALWERSNQYPPSMGVPELRDSIARRWERDTGQVLDPARSITVTSGCTEALAATFLGLFDPGDEVVLFEPTYDAYPVGCALSRERSRGMSPSTLQTSDSTRRSCGRRSVRQREQSW